MTLLACCSLVGASSAPSAQELSSSLLAGVTAYRQGDFVTAHRLLLPAATKGDARAALLLGRIASQREGTEQDMREEVRWYRKAANRGLAAAQARMASCYAAGRGVPQSDVEAVKWYLLAAAQEDVQAAASLGYYYQFGNDIPHDDTQAARWYRIAAERDHILSQNMLGVFYTSGVGVPQSAVDASAWYRRAADQGDAKGQFELAVAYYEGLGVEHDPVTAYFWITLALRNLSERGEKEAAIRLIAAISNSLAEEQIAEVTLRATAWHPAAGTTKNFAAPDETLSAAVKVSGPGGESRIDIREGNEIILTHSYASSNGQHGFVVQQADWTADSKFFVFSLSSSGGHQPWRFPIYVYSRRTNSLTALDKYTGPITDPDFHLSAPDRIDVTAKQENAAPGRIQMKLGELLSSRP